jgi:hypothetical protein
VRWRGIGASAAALAILEGLLIAPAKAGPGDQRIVVLTPSCAAAPAFFSSFVESLRVELAAHAPECCEIWDAAGPPPPASVRVSLMIDPCDASPERLLVTVDDPARGRLVNRQVSLADVSPVARPRALALAVAELVRPGGWLIPQPETAGSHDVAATAPAVSRATATPARPALTPLAPLVVSVQMPAARRASASTSARGDFVLRRYPSRQTTLYGGELSLRRAGRRLQSEAELGAMAGDRTTAFGQVAFRAATAGGEIGVRLVAGAFDTTLGVRGELGWAWIQGTPADVQVRAGSGSALLGSLGVRAAVQIPAARWFGAELIAEAGDAVRGVDGRVNGQPVAGATGAYLLVGLGASLSVSAADR